MCQTLTILGDIVFQSGGSARHTHDQECQPHKTISRRSVPKPSHEEKLLRERRTVQTIDWMGDIFQR